MDQEHRNLMEYYWPQLEELAEDQKDNLEGLQEILSELKYRSRPGAIELRRKVTLQMIKLIVERKSWPTTQADPGNKDLDPNEWPQIGMLRFLGYSVGQAGVVESSRREILDFVQAEILPPVNDPSYMKEWGEPKSWERLMKTAHSIATFARNRKRKISQYEDMAVRDWEGDLVYLKKKYYDHALAKYFDWPEID